MGLRGRPEPEVLAGSVAECIVHRGDLVIAVDPVSRCLSESTLVSGCRCSRCPMPGTTLQREAHSRLEAAAMLMFTKNWSSWSRFSEHRGPRTNDRTFSVREGARDVYQRGARGDTLGVPPERDERGGGLPRAPAVPQQVEPETVAAHGGGGGARRPRDARPGLPHALRSRRGQLRLPEGVPPPRAGGTRAHGGKGARLGRHRGTLGADRLARLGRRPAGGPGRAGEGGPRSSSPRPWRCWTS